MSELKSLKFTTIPAVEKSPVVIRRKKLIDRLESQKARAADPSHVRTVQRWIKKDGERTLTEKRVKVHPWWRTDEKGALVFFVRQGWKTIEFEKGKAGIVVGSKDQLAPVIDTLISATERGELDALLEQTKPSAAVGKRRKAH